MAVKKLFFLLFFGAVLLGAPLERGVYMKGFILEDQFGKTHHVDGKHCSVVLVVFEKKMLTDLKASLVKKDRFGAEDHVCVLSDVTPIPSLFLRWFALPAMREYPFAVMLIEKKEQNIFPKKEGMVTVVKLSEENRVLEIDHVADLRQMR